MAKIMVDITAIVIYQDMEELVGVETNFESRLVDFKLPNCFSTKDIFISRAGVVVGIEEEPSSRALLSIMFDLIDKEKHKEEDPDCGGLSVVGNPVVQVSHFSPRWLPWDTR